MPIAAFIGAHPRHPPTERAHKAQTVGVPENERRRLALMRGIGPIPPACTIDLGEDLQPTPESLRRCEARAPHAVARWKIPKQDVSPAPPTPPALERQVLPALTRNLAFSNSGVLPGVSTLVGSLAAPFPAVVVAVEAGYAFANPTIATARAVQLSLTVTSNIPGTVGEAAAGFALLPIVVSGGGGLTNGIWLHESGPVLIGTQQPLPLYPCFINCITTMVPGAEAVPFECNVTLQEVSPELLRRLVHPAFDLKLIAIRPVTYPFPKSTTHYRLAPGQRPEPLSVFARLEGLAQRLRDSPFGIPHGQFLGEAAAAGFSNPELAVSRAMALAATKPSHYALTSGL